MKHLFTYEIFESAKIGAAAVAILDRDKVLILKRGKDAPWEPGKWNLPGGVIEEGETPMQAATREAQEECGLMPEDLKSLSKHNKDDWYVEFFKSDKYTGTVHKTEECDDFKWVTLSELDNYEFVPFVREVLEKLMSRRLKNIKEFCEVKLSESNNAKMDVPDDARAAINDYVYNRCKGKYTYYELWELAEKYPDYILDIDEKGSFYNRLVRHNNEGTKIGEVTDRERFFSFIYEIKDISDVLPEVKDKNFDYTDWFNNGKIRIYRGQPDRSAGNVRSGRETNFTLIQRIAINFTDPMWVHRGYKDETRRNGYVDYADVHPKDVHIFTNVSGEMEVVAKGPLKLSGSIKIVNGKAE